jgi:LPPG:FO 2-phospho-L-lactate transferase
MHGLRICPDLDTVMYTLGGGIDEQRGWGRAGETWTVKEELAAYAADPDWFGLGDRDLATHLIRTRMLDAGYPLSAVTAALAARWQPGVTLLPMSDQRVETHVVLADPDAVLLAPSNPVVSIGTILGVPGIREALLTSPARVAGVSPIVGGAVIRGMADRCLPALGIEVSAEGVGRHYGARGSGGLLDAWLVQTGDDADVPGVDVREVPLLMSSPEATTALARAAIDAAGV